MSTGGIFQLITNDGKQDQMLMATNALNERLEKIAGCKRESGMKDCTATLRDIEQTHVLFTNARFKPFVAIGFEYNKQQPEGTASLGGTCRFSIPQFGDFFNDMVVHVVLKQPTLTTPTDPDVSTHNLFRWCNYPGERLIKKVKFTINGNPLDEYTRDAVNLHREFCVSKDKQLAWERCMGQEVAEDGHLDQAMWASSGVSADSVTHRMCVQSKSGYQTPTGVKTEDLELFIPLLFWFNKDSRLSVPSVAIPYGQRFIEVELCDRNELLGVVPRGGVSMANADSAAYGQIPTGFDPLASGKFELYINNIFVNPEVHNIFIKRIGFSLIRVHLQQQFSVASATQYSVQLQQLKWPVEALFLGLRPTAYDSTDAVDRRTYLDKWHAFSTVSDTARLSQGWKSSKVSVVYSGATPPPGLSAGVSHTWAAVASTPVTMTMGTGDPLQQSLKAGDTYSFSQGGVSYTLTVSHIDDAGAVFTFYELGDDFTALAAANGTGDTFATASDYSIVRAAPEEVSSTVSTCASSISSLGLDVHGITVYQEFPSKFYNAYVPYSYGGEKIRAPEDCGAHMITFCLHPGTYQPSGHINVSRAREFYLKFTSTIASGKLLVLASAINFLLISDGSAVLRYTT